jgi:hypothetical protein
MDSSFATALSHGMSWPQNRSKPNATADHPREKGPKEIADYSMAVFG